MSIREATVRPYISVLIIWFLVAVIGLLGYPVALIAALFDTGYSKRIMNAHNRLAAAIFGWSGAHGVSHECGNSDCTFCKILCPILAWALKDPNHCEKEGK